MVNAFLNDKSKLNVAAIFKAEREFYESKSQVRDRSERCVCSYFHGDFVKQIINSLCLLYVMGLDFDFPEGQSG